jgi:hypothetical protein
VTGVGVFIGLRVEICVGDGVCASWCGVQIGFPSRGGGQVRAGVKVEVCRSG